jgi:pyridoxal phosphate enzyme (YggS family)
VEHVHSNLAAVRTRIAAAAHRAGRDPGEIRLIAVSKTFPAEAIRAAWDAGQRDFGENKVQEALLKQEQTADLPIQWHLIGHLQSNKAKRAADRFAAIHSIDSVELLERVDAAAAEQGAMPEIFLQVDLAGEETKFGAPQASLESLARAAAAGRAVRLAGLMVLPPWSEDPEAARPYFRRLREIRDALARSGVDASLLSRLSMGMSHDFEVAIEEGATDVRVGTAIFGKRERKAT